MRKSCLIVSLIFASIALLCLIALFVGSVVLILQLDNEKLFKPSSGINKAILLAADSTTARTKKDFLIRSRKYFQELTIEPCLRETKFPQFRDQTKAFLDAVNDILSSDKSLKNEKLLNQGRELFESGNRDPIFLTWYGILLKINDRETDALDVLMTANDGFQKSDYSSNNRYYCLRNIGIILLDRQDARYHRFQRLAFEELRNAIVNDDYKNCDIGHVYERIKLCWPGDCDGGPQWEYFDWELRNKHVSPWLKLMIAGQNEINTAWEDRGAGWASSVTQKGWDGFAKHLDKAREALSKAHALRPDLPYSATKMIAVAMGGHAGKGETTELWFGRAIRAQFDYAPAYDQYLWAIHPRWCGSREEMMEFGEACLHTKRYDTIVPYYYIVALWNVLKETPLSEWQEILSRKKTQANIAVYYEDRMEANKGNPEKTNQLILQKIVLSFYSGNYSGLKEDLKKLPAGYSCKRLFPRADALSWYFNIDRMTAEAELLTGKYQQEYKRYKQLLRDGRREEARKIIEAIFGKLAENDKIRGYLRDLIALAMLDATNEDLTREKTPLHLAMIKRNIDAAKFLIDNGADTGKHSHSKYYPLHFAAESGFTEGVDLLLQKRCEVNVKTMDGKTPLIEAVKNHHYDIAEKLIKNGADVSSTMSGEWGPLHFACMNGDLRLAKLLVRNGADITVPTSDGWSPVHCATYHMHPEVVEFLLQKGANPNTKNRFSITPLHHAISKRTFDIVRILLAHKADPNLKVVSGENALMTAVKNNQPETVKLLLQHNADVTALNDSKSGVLHYAVYYIKNEDVGKMLELLIRAGADINGRTKSLSTPLLMAIQHNPRAAEYLIDHGADVTLPDKNNCTPLFWLAKRKYKDPGHEEYRLKLLRAILAKDTNVNVRSASGNTPLDAAIQLKNKDVIAELRKHGAKTSAELTE